MRCAANGLVGFLLTACTADFYRATRNADWVLEHDVVVHETDLVIHGWLIWQLLMQYRALMQRPSEGYTPLCAPWHWCLQADRRIGV